jgi:hypothetical protein
MILGGVVQRRGIGLALCYQAFRRLKCIPAREVLIEALNQARRHSGIAIGEKLRCDLARLSLRPREPAGERLHILAAKVGNRQGRIPGSLQPRPDCLGIRSTSRRVFPLSACRELGIRAISRAFSTEPARRSSKSQMA